MVANENKVKHNKTMFHMISLWHNVSWIQQTTIKMAWWYSSLLWTHILHKNCIINSRPCHDVDTRTIIESHWIKKLFWSSRVHSSKSYMNITCNINLKRQAITWTDADPVHWRIYAALRGDELRSSKYMSTRFMICISNYFHGLM